MPVYKKDRRTTYTYDFKFRGRRFVGNTGKTNKREAERELARIKDQVKARAARQEAGRLTIGEAFARYFLDVGQHHANADNTLRELEWMQARLGADTWIDQVTTRHVNDLIAKRRGEPIRKARKDRPAQYAAPATVNRTVTVRLRAVFSHARNVWKVTVGDVDWRRLMLKETDERVRELSDDEQARLFAALRPDYHPIVKVALASGCRREELIGLTWRHVDFASGNLSVTGKGRKFRLIPMTAKIRDELAALRVSLGAVPAADDPVFTYVVERTRKDLGLIRGTRQPIRAEGLKSIYARAIEKAGIKDFRFHDLRHTRATRLLRDSGNLRLVQNLLGHKDIATTLKYAHVTNDDLKRAMESADRTEATKTVSPTTSEAKT